MKTVSVIIPTYKNRGKLKECIESVLHQEYVELFEVIVVDDNDPCSQWRVDTEKIMLGYQNNPVIHYIKHDRNKNGSAARNTGINAAKGDYIALLDDDDIFLPEKLSKQVRFLENHKDMDAVYCFERKENSDVVNKTVFEGNAIKEILLLKTNFQTSTLMFRSNVINSLNGFDETFIRHQDLELMLRFFHKGYKLGCVPEVLVVMGKNNGENIPNGTKLESLKEYFFSKFESFILEEDFKTPGFRKKVYAKHYASVFLSHVKHKHIFMAVRTLVRYSYLSPMTFGKVITNSLILHINGKA